jgi:high-affinity Fe2+/Pb2+ permease
MGEEMGDFTSGALALAMIAAFLLAALGVKIAWKKETRGRGMLMILAAAVLVMNVMIATV